MSAATLLLPVLVCLMLFLAPAGPAGATALSYDVGVVINASLLSIPAHDQQAFIKDGRVYVPLRAVGKNLGCEVEWIRETRQVVITSRGRPADPLKRVPPGTPAAALPGRTGDRQRVQIVVDGQIKEFSADYGEPFITAAGRTVVPLRAVGEALGCEVDWNSATRLVTIRSKPQAPPPSRGPEEYGETRPSPSGYPGAPGGTRFGGSAGRRVGLLQELAEYRTNLRLLDGTFINSAELVDKDEENFSQAQLDRFRSDLDDLRKYDARVRLPDGREWATAELTILGPAIATADQLRAWLEAEARKRVRTEQWGREFVPFPDLVDLYLRIGAEYGVRGDLALAQAAKETGYWQFGGDVQPDQNNFCGLWATGTALTGGESLNGADPALVRLEAGRHGATFATPQAGVEAHIQHLYAYATTDPLPPGKVLLSPRFVYVQRGSAPTWQGLNARWAVPGTTYGQSIIHDFWLKALYY
ncbi:stalk domain-containing protein [Candidatus Desulforudis audaxviator]|uniref:Copper amine oxidase domain protein n=1 Tax=Desulforudis audaxviator (strain MP104C) TaxID=477974 RepID=B1I223_DESAP|nr:stalk domain-containing protein [Candidatus Desulforudis audaxviator]ACA58982.1 copper amine oxidase domain protein [Candidatus Desulforudis audaxviator MP104C]